MENFSISNKNYWKALFGTFCFIFVIGTSAIFIEDFIFKVLLFVGCLTLFLIFYMFCEMAEKLEEQMK